MVNPRLSRITFITLLGFCSTGTTFCQTVINRSTSITIPSIALLDIEPSSSTISLSFIPPAEAGLAMDVSGGADNSKWLNYSSANSVSVSRAISVQISSGTLGSGLNLTLIASSYTGSGSGTFATSAGSKVLSSTPQVLLTGLSSCFTGNGSGNGHLLTYTLGIANYGNIRFANNSSLVITYTMVDL